MIKLIINAPENSDQASDLSFGGLPIKNKDTTFEWPLCKTCNSEMQYQGRIKTDLGHELIFMCQNDPGMCDEWEADNGGNKVIIIDDNNLEFVNPNNEEIALRKTTYVAKLMELAAENYNDAMKQWDGKPRDLLGQFLGEPDWLQGEQTPNCNCCNKEMRFVAQLEEGPDYQTAMNFGGGVAYLFDCPRGKTAKFLWQC